MRNATWIPLLLVALLSIPGGAQGRRPDFLPRRPRPLDALLARKISELVHGPGRITRGKVLELASFATDSGGSTRGGSWALRLLVKRYPHRFADQSALEAARALVNRPPSPMRRPDNTLFRVQAAADTHQTRSQALYIKGDGELSQATGIRTFSRGWLQANRSPLARAHGSTVPRSRVLTPQEHAALEAATPGQRLDRAVKLLLGKDKVGMSSFSEMGTGATFSRPDQPDWSGFCYSWAHCALDSRLSRMVDVRGKPGERGLWIAGQWLSRADLGNWLSAAASAYAQGEGQVMWFNPQAEDLVKASLGYLMRGGKGFRADIGPALKNPEEVWFQPFTGARVKISSIPAAARQQVLGLAARPERAHGVTAPGIQGSDVKLIQIRGRYGDEQGDGHEGPPSMASLKWNAYAVLDGNKKAVRFFMANDPKLTEISGLPTRSSSAVPRDLFVPNHWFVDAILNDIPEPSLKHSLYGPHLKFLVGSVLARGVPGRTRAAFENEQLLQGNGRLERRAVKDLARRYPTVANAYAPEQWERCFASRGLDARRFGRPTFKEEP